MFYLGVVLSIILLAAMAYMALDKKRSFQTRVAALIALGIMILTVIICFFIVLTDDTVPIDDSKLIVGAPVEVQKAGNDNTLSLLLIVVVLVGMFAFVAFHALKEHRKKNTKTPGNFMF